MNLKKYANDPAAFRADLFVDVDGQAKRFAEVMDEWQATDFASLDPALKLAAGRSTEPAKMRAFIERPRGHSKTSDLACIAVWTMSFANRPLRGYCYAADKDQARLLRDAVATVIRLNPWLADILVVEANRVVTISGPADGSTLTIEASDVGSSYGILPDLIIADELCHWEGDGSLWHSLISSAAKRSNCFLCVITNAGFQDSWQWEVREAARTDEAWHFSRLDGPQASWITPARLEEQRRMLPQVAFNRLWLNEWSTGGGDALTAADVEGCFDKALSPMTRWESGWYFIAGLDLGLTRDASACVLLAVPQGGKSGRIRLAHTKLWRPMLGRKISLTEVESHLLELDEKFGLECCAFDPWQAEHLAQRIEADSGRRRRNGFRRFGSEPFMREVPPTGSNLRDQASLLIESVQDRRFQFFPDENLRRDLLRLRIVEKSYGYRVESPRDGNGHGDTFSAFSLALLTAHELAGKAQFVIRPFDADPSDGQPRLEYRLRKLQEAHAYEVELLKMPEPDPLEEFGRLMRWSRGL